LAIEVPSLIWLPSKPLISEVSQKMMLILSELTPLDTAAGLAKLILMFIAVGLTPVIV